MQLKPYNRSDPALIFTFQFINVCGETELFMKKIIAICLTAFLLFIFSAASFAYTGNGSYGTVPKAYEELKIDGEKDAMYDKGVQIDVTRPNPEMEGFASLRHHGRRKGSFCHHISKWRRNSASI
jgi:hypothetical protein